MSQKRYFYKYIYKKKKLDPMILVQEQLKNKLLPSGVAKTTQILLYNLIVYIAKVLITLTLVKRMFTLSYTTASSFSNFLLASYSTVSLPFFRSVLKSAFTMGRLLCRCTSVLAVTGWAGGW